MTHATKKDQNNLFHKKSKKIIAPSSLCLVADSLSDRTLGLSSMDDGLIFQGIEMHRGYIKLWRKLEDSAFFRDPAAFHVFTYLLIKAQFESDKYSCTFEGNHIYLQKGQWVTGRNCIAKAIGWPPSTVRNALKRLESKYHMITLKQDNKRTIVTLLNWDTYQNGFQKQDSERTTRGQQLDTNKELRIRECKEGGGPQISNPTKAQQHVLNELKKLRAMK